MAWWAIRPACVTPLFELLGLSPGLEQLATQGSEESVKQLHETVSKLVRRVLMESTDSQGKLIFWGKPLLTDDEIRDWRIRLDALNCQVCCRPLEVGKLFANSIASCRIRSIND